MFFYKKELADNVADAPKKERHCHALALGTLDKGKNCHTLMLGQVYNNRTSKYEKYLKNGGVLSFDEYYESIYKEGVKTSEKNNHF